MQSLCSHKTKLGTGVGNRGESINLMMVTGVPPENAVCLLCTQSCWRQVYLESQQSTFPVPVPTLKPAEICPEKDATVILPSWQERTWDYDFIVTRGRETAQEVKGWGLTGGFGGIVHETSSRRTRREWNYHLGCRCGALRGEQCGCDLIC